MTIDVDVPVADAAASAPATPARRRPGPIAIFWIVVGALAMLALVGWWIWSAVSASAVGGVRVVYDAQPLVCEGSEVGVHPSSDNPEFLQPVAVLTPGMRCELRMQIVNDGWSEVTVTTVGLIGMHDGNALALEPAFVNPNGSERLADIDGEGRPDQLAGAFFDIMGGIPVPAGETATFAAMIEYSGGAHMAECSAQGWNPPVVAVAALGAIRHVQPLPETMVWFQEGGLDECAEPVG